MSAARLWLEKASHEARIEVAAFLQDNSILHETRPAHFLVVDIPCDDRVAVLVDSFVDRAGERAYVRVRCTREYVIAGPFTCVNQGAGFPFATVQGSAKPVAPRPSARAAPVPVRSAAPRPSGSGP